MYNLTDIVTLHVVISDAKYFRVMCQQFTPHTCVSSRFVRSFGRTELAKLWLEYKTNDSVGS